MRGPRLSVGGRAPVIAAVAVTAVAFLVLSLVSGYLPLPGQDRAADRDSGRPAPAPTAAPSPVTRGNAGPDDADPVRGPDVDAPDAGVDTSLENRREGAANWQVGGERPGTSIEGYADAVSLVAGRPLGLFVSSTAATFQVKIFRTGDYDGRWARLVWTSPQMRGGVQTARAVDERTRMVSARWKRSATVPTAGWAPGAYLARLAGADGATSYVPFIVRDEVSTGAVVLVNSVATWQAYNSWGGPNTYRGPSGDDEDEEGGEDATGRAVKASFDRPYDRERGAADFIKRELPVIAAAERMGLRLNYAADVDLELHPEVLDGAVGVVLLGHSEYWSRRMRDNVTAARDRGVNLAFLGANDVYRRIRLEPSRLGSGRVLVNYKLAELDPVKTQDTTGDWPRPPFARPQSELLGTMYRCMAVRGDLKVDPEAWIFKGMGLRSGTLLKDVLGPEIDRVDLRYPTPRPLEVLAHSPLTCRGKPAYADTTWYRAPSGAGVFSAGTMDWARGLVIGDDLTRRVLAKATERVLARMATPLAGVTQPPRDNVDRYYTLEGKYRRPAGTK